MVVCVIALVVFAILGIFSASHRALAREAFDCVFRKMTLRPCNTGLDARLRMIVSMKVMKRSEAAGKFVHANFEMISLLFTVLMVGSMALTGVGIYNYWAFGNCNGPGSSELCVFNPETYSGTNPWEWLFPKGPGDLKPVSSTGLPMRGVAGAPVQIIEVGCFSCPFTKATEPLVEEMLAKYEGKIGFYYKYFPLPKHEYSLESSEAAECARDQNKFWEYKELLFTRQLECTQQPGAGELHTLHVEFAKELGLDTNEFSACMNSGKYVSYVEDQKQESIDARIYGTPTFFMNGRALVAPKTLEEFSKIIDEELAKAGN